MNSELTILREIYGFDFPNDFFEFYEFSQENPSFFRGGLAGYESPLGISLGNVFNVFEKKNDFKNSHTLKTDRYYNDPPEFFTLLRGNSDGLHWGYYVDAPGELPPVISSYYSNDAFELSYNGVSLFEMLRAELESCFEGALENINDPEYENSENHLQDLNEMREKLKNYETGQRLEVGDEYLEKYHLKRDTIAKTRCKMGIIVPKSKFKESTHTDKFQIWNYEPEQHKILKLEKECDQLFEKGIFGNHLKLGKDLWIYNEFRETSYRSLEKSYKALGRNVLLKSLQAAKEWREECDKNRI